MAAETPAAPWDGVPLNPERSGPHWLRLFGDTEPSVVLWFAKVRAWTDLGGTYPAQMYGGESEYLGPCLTPSEVAASLAAARIAGNAEAYGAVQCAFRELLEGVPNAEEIEREALYAIENLPAPTGADALAAHVAAAVAAAVPPGHVVVPLEPTEAMRSALREALETTPSREGWTFQVSRWWSAMIRARAAAQEPQG